MNDTVPHDDDLITINYVFIHGGPDRHTMTRKVWVALLLGKIKYVQGLLDGLINRDNKNDMDIRWIENYKKEIVGLNCQIERMKVITADKDIKEPVDKNFIDKIRQEMIDSIKAPRCGKEPPNLMKIH